MPIGNGGIIGPANVPTLLSAKGVWSLREAQLAKRQGIWPPFNAGADPYFEYTTLLLPGNGTNGTQNNTFLDSSSNAFTVTRNPLTGPNAPTQGTFSPFSQTGWGNYFDGSSYLSIADNAAFNVGSGNFTAECWIYPKSFANEAIIMGQWSGDVGGTTLNWALLLSSGSTGYLRLITSSNGSSVLFDLSTSSTSFTLTLNTWQHIAAVRSGNDFTIYVNGVSRATTTNASSLYDATNNFTIGAESNTQVQYFIGNISNVRVVKGRAVYTSAFTPPTSPLGATSGGQNPPQGTETSLLTCQSNRFIDNSTNNFTITPNGSPSVQAFSPFNPSASWSAATNGGSGYFDGSGDYLSAAQNAAFNLGTAAFTVEAWINLSALPSPSSAGIITLGNGAAGAGPQYCGWGLWVNTNGTIVFERYDGTEISRLTSTTITLNQWNHIVAVRDSSSNFAIFINGVRGYSAASATTSYNNVNSDLLYVGRTISGAGPTTNYLTGYIGDVRVVAGTAVYSATSTTLTVPTAPLTAITNTSLLLNFTNAGIYDATSKNLLETVGGAQVSTAVSNPFGASTGVVYLDGTGDYLKTLDKEFYDFGTGDFTLEGWVYHTTSADINRTYIVHGSGGFWFYRRVTTGQLELELGGSALITSSSAVAANVWTHVAASRSGTSLKLFINGTQEASTTNSTSIAGTTAVFVGMNTDGTSNPFIGYMSNMRVTKGYARYTSSFTVPSSDFPTF